MKINTKVKIKDIQRLKQDEHLEEQALKIIEASNYEGVITKVIDDVFMVGFKNDIGWVTQGYKANEIEVL